MLYRRWPTCIQLKELQNFQVMQYGSSRLVHKHITIEDTYQRVIGNIKEDIRNKFLWLTVDETTDFCGSKVVNVLIRILGVSDISHPDGDN
ncbi:hypothetical protein NQ318_018843 [Aromia moschata]|uniref:DUF4371 domain-containing protein n=1 Tax=Aromia moschata TaxID=1265417 RepID=A0AAV8ZIR4_9CUCU|nr:hypothetical protein NQ318_018843 [Aromia moschata]